MENNTQDPAQPTVPVSSGSEEALLDLIRASDERVGKLEQMLTSFLQSQTQTPKQPQPEKPVSEVTALAQEVEALKAASRAKELFEKKSAAESKILEQVPAANRAAVAYMIPGFMQGMDPGQLSADELANRIYAQLKSALPNMVVDTSRRGFAQTKPDGSFDWDRVTHFSEVPADRMAEMPHDVHLRLRANLQGVPGNGTSFSIQAPMPTNSWAKRS